ncbi:MAG: YkgJ family cysteine cluster protein [Desulfosarcina sp.]|nr:YkgJ family cysteine cluster protein [Desulfobacterales bacterium]
MTKIISENSGIDKCRRCGTCCKKGGPSLHLEDRELVEGGMIPLKHLFTIRKGEPANDNIRRSIQPAATDIIKIKGQGNTLSCRFFNPKDNICKIYEHRALECRVLKCWDTEEIERIYSKNRLVRKDLIYKVAGLWDLVEEHQQRCSYDIIQNLVSLYNRDKKTDSMKMLIDIINYEMHFRRLIIDRSGMDPEMLDFLFGRPLTDTIRMFGVENNFHRNLHLFRPVP